MKEEVTKPKSTTKSPITKKVVKPKVQKRVIKYNTPPKIIKSKTPPEIKYGFAGKEPLFLTITKSIPKELVPTKRTGYIFGAIFLLVIIIGLFNFPLSEMMAGNTNASMDVGLPMVFLRFNLMDIAEPPVKMGGLIIDLLLYLFIAYAIDVIINLVMNNRLTESAEERKKKPEVFRYKEQPKTKAISEKIADKVIQKLPPEKTKKPSAI